MEAIRAKASVEIDAGAKTFSSGLLPELIGASAISLACEIAVS
jgi:hypothetical protein